MLPVVAQDRQRGKPTVGDSAHFRLQRGAARIARANLIEECARKNVIPGGAGALRVDIVQEQAVAVDDTIKHFALLNAVLAVERSHVEARECAAQHGAEGCERLATIAWIAHITW